MFSRFRAKVDAAQKAAQQRPLVQDRQQFQGIAKTAATEAAGLNPAADSSLDALTARLRRSVSPAGRMDVVAPMVGNVSDSFDRAEAQTLARNRFQGGDDAYLAGQRANIASGRAEAVAGATNQATQIARGEEADASMQLFQVLQGLLNDARSREMQGLGAVTGVNQFLLSAEQAEKAQEEARKQAEADRQAELWGSLGQTLLLGFM